MTLNDAVVIVFKRCVNETRSFVLLVYFARANHKGRREALGRSKALNGMALGRCSQVQH